MSGFKFYLFGLENLQIGEVVARDWISVSSDTTRESIEWPCLGIMFTQFHQAPCLVA